MLGLRGCEVEWVFDKGRLFGRQGAPQHLAFIMSAAYRSVPMTNAELVGAAEVALRRYFPAMNNATIERTLVLREPDATFYAFVSLDGFPEPIAQGMDFFRAALDHQVICVPGVFFDVNPGRRRLRRYSRFHQHVRLSFGPPMAEVAEGLDRLGEMVRSAE